MAVSGSYKVSMSPDLSGFKDEFYKQIKDVFAAMKLPELPEIPMPKIPTPKIPVPKIPMPEIPAPKIPAPKIPKPEIPAPTVPDGFFKAFATKVKASAESIGGAFSSVGSKVSAPFKAAGVTIQTALQNTGITAAAGFIGNFAGKMGSGIANVASSMTGAFRSVGQQIGNILGSSGLAGAARFVGDFSSRAVSGVTNAVSSMSKTIVSGISSAAQTAGQAVSDALKIAASVGGAALAGTVAVSMAKGWGRLESIDEARTKLSALGNDAAAVDTLMDKAMKSVSGTAFGLGDAAGAVASLSAAKVPTEQLDKSLSAMVSTAALAGAPLDEMSRIFSQAAAQGKIDGATLDSLLTRQVPILSMIQEKYGVTAEAAKKMVSEGKVSFTDFIDLMGKNSEAAAIMGTSMKGLKDNTLAALGRMGAAAQQPIFDAMKIALPGVIALVNQLTAAIKPVAELALPVLTKAATAFTEKMEKLKISVSGDQIKEFFSAMGPLTPLILGVAGAFGGLLSSLPIIGPLFASITAPVGVLVGSLIALFALKPETLLSGFESLNSKIPAILERAVGAASDIIPKMAARLTENLPILIAGFIGTANALIPAIGEIVKVLAETFTTMVPQLASSLASMAPLLTQGFVTLLNTLIPAIASMLPVIILSFAQLLPLLLGSLQTIFGAVALQLPLIIQQLATAFSTLLPQAVTFIVEQLPVFIEGLMALLETIAPIILAMIPTLVDSFGLLLPVLIESLVTVVLGLVDMLPSILVTIVTALVSLIPVLLEGAIKLFSALITALPQIITSLVKDLPSLIGQIVKALVEAIPLILSGAFELFGGLLVALPEIIDELIKIVPSLLGSLADLFINGGGEIIGGLIKGLFDAFPKVIKFVTDMIGSIFGAFTDFFKIRSPSKLMADGVGAHIPTGISAGIKKTSGSLMRDIDRFNKDVYAQFNSDIALTPINKLPVGDIDSRGSKAVVFNQYNSVPAPESLSDVSRANKRGSLSALKEL